MEIISSIALISINETLLVQMLSFLVFMLLLNRIMVRPLRSSMADREDYIDSLWAEITASEKEIDAIALRIEEQETAARQTAHALRKELEAAGSETAGSILASARQDVNRQRQETRDEIDALLKAFRKKLKKESEDIAVNLMEKTLRRKVTP